MFEAALKSTGLQAHEICHIGDHPINDVQASYEFGNRAVWFKEDDKELGLDIEVPFFTEWRDLPNLLENI
jgi:FMN phosphatase YigB (HAD superfamily)